MTNVLIVYASRHGGTKGIAERIGAVLGSEGLACTVAAVEQDPDPALADACILGSGVYMGSWLKEATDYAWRHSGALAARQVWLFSSGPLKGSTAKGGADLVEDALGPADGPGSGGRKKVEEISAAIHPRDHRVFYGAFDPTDPPRAMAERLVRMMPAFKGVLPAGDFREWDVIDAWAVEIARHCPRSCWAGIAGIAGQPGQGT
jgi:menaquinone-dependent protoporphyrinogen oxidase